MRRFPLIAAILAGAALVLLLGACGGDDDGESALTTPIPVETAPTGPTGADAGGGENGERAQSGSGSKKERSSSSDRKKKSSGGGGGGGPGSSGGGSGGGSGSQQNTTTQPSKREVQELETAFKEATEPDFQAQVSYAAAKKVCRERKMKDIKALYKPKGESAEAVARAVSQAYRPKHRRDAAYRGCLAGFKQR